jgi:2-amino-4-hydroxy-6-hydroxymethyldihydropteridine diphosphokinase
MVDPVTFMKTAYIGIGSNMDDPRRNCLDALDRMGRIDDCRIISVSGLYLTEPVGVKTREWYINGAVSISTGLSAYDLIRKLLDIEKDMGRVRTIKWGPRIIDLDILLFGRDIINDKILTVPHPMMHLRRFVMAPMADLAPDLMHPVLERTMIELYREIPPDNQVIKRVEGA